MHDDAGCRWKQWRRQEHRRPTNSLGLMIVEAQ
jgi:hypothetical protein